MQPLRDEIAQGKPAQVVQRRRSEQPKIVESADAIAHVPAQVFLSPQPVQTAVPRMEVQGQDMTQPFVALGGCGLASALTGNGHNSYLHSPLRNVPTVASSQDSWPRKK